MQLAPSEGIPRDHTINMIRASRHLSGEAESPEEYPTPSVPSSPFLSLRGYKTYGRESGPHPQHPSNSIQPGLDP